MVGGGGGVDQEVRPAFIYILVLILRFREVVCCSVVCM